MKFLFIILIASLPISAFSQVIISDAVGTAATKTSVLMEFANTNNRGIILPYVRTLPTTGTGLVEGTLILDATDATKAVVKYYNGSWVDLNSGSTANIDSQMTTQPTSVAEDPNAMVVIGAATTTASGVLVLESTAKSMVLPMVDSTDNIINPAPGMMVYINKTGAKRLAVFNGGGWSYWKSSN